jgi:multidrug resistance efflux pump
MTFLRKEYKGRRSNPSIGSVSIRPSNNSKLFLAGISFLLVVISLMLIRFSYTSRITVTGIVAPAQGISQVVSPVSGIIRSIGVDEGMEVAAGDKTAVVDNRKFSEEGAVATERSSLIEQTIASLEYEIVAEKRRFQVSDQQLIRQLTAARGLARDSAQTIDTEESQLAVHKAALKRQESLVKLGFISANQLDEKKLAVLSQENSLRRANVDSRNAELQIREIESNIENLRNDSDQRISALRRQITSARASGVELRESGPLVIKAPVKGVASGVVVRPGQYVREGQILFSIVPRTENARIFLFIPTDQMARVQLSGEVAIRTIANDYRHYGLIKGKIIGVTNVPIGSSEASIDIGRGDSAVHSSVYRLAVQVTSMPQKMPHLTNGMSIEADLRADSRRLSEWASTPLQRVLSSFQ